jgi:spermidine synthase
MLQDRLMAELLLAHVPHPKRILEIGSGDGRFMVPWRGG